MGTRPFSFADVDAFLAPSPRPSPLMPSPSPSPLSAIDAFLAQQPQPSTQPTPAATPNPLDGLFGQQPSPSPLGSPAPDPDTVDLPGQDETRDVPGIVSRFLSNFRESALPEHLTDIVEGPARAVLALGEAASGQPQRLVDYAGLMGNATVEGAKGQIAAAERAESMPEKVARYLAAAVPMIGPGIAQTGEKVGERVAEGDYAGAAGQVAGTLIDPGALIGLAGKGVRMARAASAVPSLPPIVDRVARTLSAADDSPTGAGTRPAPPPEPPRAGTAPATAPEGPAAHPDADLSTALDRVPEAVRPAAKEVVTRLSRQMAETGRFDDDAFRAGFVGPLAEHADALKGEIVDRAAGIIQGRDALDGFREAFPEKGPDGVTIERQPGSGEGTFVIVQRHNGEIVGGATVNNNTLTMVAGGKELGSPVSIGPVMAKIDELGVKRNDVLTPFGKGSRRTFQERQNAAIRGPAEEATGGPEPRPGDQSPPTEAAGPVRAEEGSGGGAPPRQPPTTEGVGAPEPPGSDPVKKLLGLIRNAAPRAIRETEALRAPERVRRAQMIGDLRRSVGNPEEAAIAAKRAVAGEMPSGQLEPFKNKLSQDDVTALFNRIRNHPEIREWEWINTQDALKNLLEGGRIPQRHELALLERVFGVDLSKAVLSRRALGEKAWDFVQEGVNLPRSLVSSVDMSAPFRQGLQLTVGRPRQSGPAAVAMAKSFFSENAFRAVEQDIRTRKNAPLYHDSGLYLADTQRATDLTAREEAFMGANLAESIPVVKHLVRASNRAYVTYLNKLRADVFDKIADVWKKQGVTPETAPSKFSGLAEYVNIATGRGRLGQLERVAPLLNGAFFSPRFVAATLQSVNPAYYAKMDPLLRREAMRDVVALYAAAATVAGLAAASGAKVEQDPRSSDFWKIRVGRTRFDILGGRQQVFRYLAQFLSGQRKAENGGIQDVNRVDTAGRFLRSKESPVASTVHDFLATKDFIGREVTPSKAAKDLLTWPPSGEFAELFTPMFLGDFYDAAREHGLVKGGAMATPAFFGVGVTTHQDRGESGR